MVGFHPDCNDFDASGSTEYKVFLQSNCTEDAEEELTKLENGSVFLLPTRTRSIVLSSLFQENTFTSPTGSDLVIALPIVPNHSVRCTLWNAFDLIVQSVAFNVYHKISSLTIQQWEKVISKRS